MRANGYYEVSDVPALLKRGMVGMMAARGALLEAAEQIVSECGRTGRAMTREEQMNVDEYMAHVADIGADLAERKRECIANNDSGLPVIFPFERNKNQAA
jgi:hypothetical protein